MGIMVVEDLERSDTVAREPTTRAKTIVILTVRVSGLDFDLYVITPIEVYMELELFRPEVGVTFFE